MFSNLFSHKFQRIFLNYGLLEIINTKMFRTIKEIFQLFAHKRKFYMFPIIILLIALIGVTALSQSGLIAFIYPI